MGEAPPHLPYVIQLSHVVTYNVGQVGGANGMAPWVIMNILYMTDLFCRILYIRLQVNSTHGPLNPDNSTRTTQPTDNSTQDNSTHTTQTKNL